VVAGCGQTLLWSRHRLLPKYHGEDAESVSGRRGRPGNNTTLRAPSGHSHSPGLCTQHRLCGVRASSALSEHQTSPRVVSHHTPQYPHKMARRHGPPYLPRGPPYSLVCGPRCSRPSLALGFRCHYITYSMTVCEAIDGHIHKSERPLSLVEMRGIVSLGRTSIQDRHLHLIHPGDTPSYETVHRVLGSSAAWRRCCLLRWFGCHG